MDELTDNSNNSIGEDSTMMERRLPAILKLIKSTVNTFVRCATV